MIPRGSSPWVRRRAASYGHVRSPFVQPICMSAVGHETWNIQAPVETDLIIWSVFFSSAPTSPSALLWSSLYGFVSALAEKVKYWLSLGDQVWSHARGPICLTARGERPNPAIPQPAPRAFTSKSNESAHCLETTHAATNVNSCVTNNNNTKTTTAAAATAKQWLQDSTTEMLLLA